MCPGHSPQSECTQNVPKTRWTTSESPVARPIYTMCPGGKQTHKVYIHIYKRRNVNNNSK